MTDNLDRSEGARDRTVIVNNDRPAGRSRGGAGWFIAGLLAAVVIVGGFLLYNSGMIGGGGGDTNISVDVPEMEIPDVSIDTGGGGGSQGAN